MRQLIAVTVLAVAAAGCERVVTISAPEGEKLLVVEARLEQVAGVVSGVQRVKLTTTDAVFSKTAPPPARGAIVRVADDSGRVVAYSELPAEPGVYATSALIATAGRRYTLRITYAGNEYSSTELLRPAVPIDSMYFTRRLTQIGPASGLRATLVISDPPVINNYYLWDQFIDGRRLFSDDTAGFFKIVSDDEFFDGGTVRDFQPFGGIVVKSGELITVRQSSISQEATKYFSALNTQVNSDGSPFGTAPASLRGNVTNLSRPGVPALGFFVVAGVSVLSRRVP